MFPLFAYSLSLLIIFCHHALQIFLPRSNWAAHAHAKQVEVATILQRMQCTMGMGLLNVADE